jgi:hypothetical protein
LWEEFVALPAPVPGEPGPAEVDFDADDVSREDHCDDHPAKRVHREATPESRQSSSVDEVAGERPFVTRSERTNLLRLFRKERRLARRIFRNSAQVSWDKEIAEHLESKENRPAQEFFPSEEEVEAEAFETTCLRRCAVLIRSMLRSSLSSGGP